MEWSEIEYSAAFTGAGLMFPEMESLYPVLIQSNAIDLLWQEVKENRFLKINSESSRKRVLQEIRKRYQYTDAGFWKFYYACGEKERRLLLFYVVMKTYRIVYDFHFNVTVPRFLALETEIDAYRYKMRLDEIASAHDNVAEWTEDTREKIITRYIFMLETAGLSNGNQLQIPDVLPEFYCFFIGKREFWALDAYFLKKPDKEKLIKMCNDD